MIVLMFTLVDGFVLEKSIVTQKCHVRNCRECHSVIAVSNRTIRFLCNQTVRVKTYLLNDSSFGGSLMLVAGTFGELAALVKLTEVGLIAGKGQRSVT